EPEATLLGLVRLRRHGAVRAVELLRPAPLHQRLQRVDREAPDVRVERHEWRRTADVADPRARLDALRDFRNHPVGNAEDAEFGVVLEHADPALPKARRDGRAGAAGGPDDGDAVEHLKLQFRSGYRAERSVHALPSVAWSRVSPPLS